jgi:hypothetical protein
MLLLTTNAATFWFRNIEGGRNVRKQQLANCLFLTISARLTGKAIG